MKRAQYMTRRIVKTKRAKVSLEERAGKRGARARSLGLCERCGRRAACEVHHRKNRSQGGTWALSNLLDLCSPCHLDVTSGHRAVALEPGCGWAVASHQDPARTPAWLAGRGLCLLADDGEIHETEEEVA